MKEKLSITMDSELVERIDGLCKERGKNRSSLIEELCSQAVSSAEEEDEKSGMRFHAPVIMVIDYWLNSVLTNDPCPYAEVSIRESSCKQVCTEDEMKMIRLLWKKHSVPRTEEELEQRVLSGGKLT